jgi:hypothetical protein
MIDSVLAAGVHAHVMRHMAQLRSATSAGKLLHNPSRLCMHAHLADRIVRHANAYAFALARLAFPEVNHLARQVFAGP